MTTGNEPKTAAERDYPPLPHQAGWGVEMHGEIVLFANNTEKAAGASPGARAMLFTAGQMHAYYDLGREAGAREAIAPLPPLSWNAGNTAAPGDFSEEVAALAASPTAQAAPAAGAGPSGLTEETFCDLQFAERVLIAIAERQQQTGGVIEPVSDIRHASRLARAARTRITRALSALSADFDAALCAAPQPPAEAQEPVTGELCPSCRNGDLYACTCTHPAPQQAATIATHTCANAWFASLPEGRQAVLREDKWMLAHAAFDAGRSAGAVPVADGDAILHFIEQVGSVRIERIRAGFNGPLRWDVEYGPYDDEARGATLREAIDAARAQAKEGGGNG